MKTKVISPLLKSLGILILVLYAQISTSQAQTTIDPLSLTKYVEALPIPGFMPPNSPSTPNYYEIGAYQKTQIVHPAIPPTTVWCYGVSKNQASWPASTILCVRGTAIDVKWTNNLYDANGRTIKHHPLPIDPTLGQAPTEGYGIPIVTHLHGGESEPSSDGHFNAWFTQGFSMTGPMWTQKIYHYANTQTSATLWYHDHAYGFTRLNPFMGLAGAYAIIDPPNDPVGIPGPGGPYDVPLVIQDRDFKTDGNFYYPNVGQNPLIHPVWIPEYFGNINLVNGKVWPYLNVEKRKYRFRVLDGCQARFYDLALSNGQPFTIIASDGGFLPTPKTVTHLLIAPGERYEIIVDFSALPVGTTLILQNSANGPYPDGDAADPNTTGQVMQFRVVPIVGVDNSVIPPVLNTVLPITNPVKTRELTLNEVAGDNGPLGMYLDGHEMMQAPTEIPTVGTTEEWKIINTTMDAHPIHSHLVQFQLLSRQQYNAEQYMMDYDMMNPVIPAMMTMKPPLENYLVPGTVRGPDPGEDGWKDTYKCWPGEVTTFLIRYTPQNQSVGSPFPFDATAFPGYVWHCHILEHEEHDMMRPLAVSRVPDVDIPVSVSTTPVNFAQSGVKMQFTNIGANNVNPSVSIQRTNCPSMTPMSAGDALYLKLKITPNNLADFTFLATVTVDVSGIPGFSANTIVMDSPDEMNWVASHGTYKAAQKTFSFTTNHCCYYAFVNPVLANQVDLAVSTSPTSSDNTVFPNTSWNAPLSTASGDAFNWTPLAAKHDWTYKMKTGTYYVVPSGIKKSPRSINSASMRISWNPDIVSGVTVTEGNYFNDNGSSSLFTINNGSNWVEINASCLDSNQTPGTGKYIAKLDYVFNNSASGFSPIFLDNINLTYLSGGIENPACPVVQNNGGNYKFYLGDFASPNSQNYSDGLINKFDFNLFNVAYGSRYVDKIYRSKFDIGPTAPMGNYFGIPVPDGKIDIEDLSMFSIGLSKTLSGSLPNSPQPTSIVFAFSEIQRDANGLLKLPVRLSGNVNDLRAFSIKLKSGNDMEYSGVEMAGEMLEGLKFLSGRIEDGYLYVDGASVGENESGLSKAGEIAYILFNEKVPGNHTATIENIIARNSSNQNLNAQFNGMTITSELPKSYSLSQNYPNPFNPVTRIEYALPADVKVSIKIFDILGREIVQLVNEVKKAGYHNVEMNGTNMASGIYFYQIKAGDFVSVKKMTLIK